MPGRRRRRRERRTIDHSPDAHVHGRSERQRDHHAQDGNTADNEGKFQFVHAKRNIRTAGIRGDDDERPSEFRKSDRRSRRYQSKCE